jgi:hypothetical protein
MGNGPHDRGFLGEQSMGFFLGDQGYFFVEGPSGAAGHGVTAPGFDGVAYNPRTGHLIIYDNKAFARSGNVGSATAIDPARNLHQNLGTLIRRVNAMGHLPYRTEILDRLRRTQTALHTGKTWPINVQIAVSNASGRSTGVSQRLFRSGIQFIDYNRIQRKPSPFSRRCLNAAGVIGAVLGDLAQAIGDIGIQRQVRQRLENELQPGVTAILMRGEGVLVIIRLQEWEVADFQGRRAHTLLDVHIQGGASEQQARQAYENRSGVYQGPPKGWRVANQYAWMPPSM